jgi:hypothetical protein
MFLARHLCLKSNTLSTMIYGGSPTPLLASKKGWHDLLLSGHPSLSRLTRSLAAMNENGL